MLSDKFFQIEHSLSEWASGYHVKVTFEEKHDLPT